MPIELLKPHTHGGVLHAPGAHLEIDEATAHWLIEHGVARPAATPEGDIKPNIASRKGD